MANLFTADGFTYGGMSEETVTQIRLALGKPTVFVDEATYAAFIASHQPIPPTAQEILALLRTLAYTYVDTNPNTECKALRALILVIIDQFNILFQRDRDRAVDVSNATTLADLKTRWATRPTLNDRDITQVKPAIQAKLNAGTAD